MNASECGDPVCGVLVSAQFAKLSQSCAAVKIDGSSGDHVSSVTPRDTCHVTDTLCNTVQHVCTREANRLSAMFLQSRRRLIPRVFSWVNATSIVYTFNKLMSG